MKPISPSAQNDAISLEEGIDSVPTSKRESAKEGRRQRIIAAARDMIRESGKTGLSMRELAKRAGVSLATPYNLFGSRGAVVIAVLQDLRDFVGRYSAMTEPDPINRIFVVVNLHLEYCLSDSVFYTTLWREASTNVEDVREALLNSKRAAFWQHLIDNAAGKGAILPTVDTTLLRVQLDEHFRAAMMEWSTGNLPNELLVPSMRYGYAIILAGIATDEYRARLQDIVLNCQASIKSSAYFEALTAT